MLMSDPGHQPEILRCHLLSSSCPGILLEFKDSLKVRSVPGKSFLSDILGFPAGDGDHSLTFFKEYKTVQK
jgi:hypothetical protein